MYTPAERRRRAHIKATAFILTILLHLAIFAALYYTTQNPSSEAAAITVVGP